MVPDIEYFLKIKEYPTYANEDQNRTSMWLDNGFLFSKNILFNDLILMICEKYLFIYDLTILPLYVILLWHFWGEGIFGTIPNAFQFDL